MKAVKLFIGLALALIAGDAMAQDLSLPQYAKWGETVEERKSNIEASQYLKSELESRNYNLAAHYLQQLLANCPAASENTFVRGVTLYKNKINRATSLQERNVYVDSLFLIYDLRLEHFGSHPKRGRAYILDRKAREYLTYREGDREGIRKNFEQAISAQLEDAGAADPTMVLTYFQCLCEDFKNDIVNAETVVNAYEENAKHFANLDESQADLKAQYDKAFGVSGVASCENLEKIFGPKIEANPNDETLLAHVFGLLFKANCENDFSLSVAEKYYAIKPQSNIAMLLAQIFQKKEEYSKANHYLREALASETDPAEREKLLIRVGILEMALKNYSAAVKAFNESLNVDATEDDGLALYFLAQCYVAGSSGCGGGIGGRAVYWYACDLLNQAIPLLEKTDASVAANARKLAGSYRACFPSGEECFFAELNQGAGYTIGCGLAKGKRTSVRYR